MSSDRFHHRRDYPRQSTTALVWLVAALSAAFVIQLAMLSPWFSGTTAVLDYLRLTVRSFQQGQIWTLATHGLLHSTSNPLHIIFSLLSLVLIGRELEAQLGGRKFFTVFIGSLVIGAFCWLALHWRSGGAHIGPSAGIMGLLVVLARLYASQEMNFVPFFLFSVTMRPMYFVYGLAAIDLFLLLFFELPAGNVPFAYAPSAHLGGMLGGWLFFRFLYANNGWDRAASFNLPSWLRSRDQHSSEATPREAASSLRSGDFRADVDRILDKINSDGFGSLSEEEKRILDDAKDLLSKH
jgi:membrane associated rhomboid family serine protease